MTTTIADLTMTIADLTGVEPERVATDAEAREAAQWVDLQRKTEAEIDSLLDPAIKTAFAAHKKLTGQKKTLLEGLVSAKDRVRVRLANWIAGGRAVPGCYIKTTWKVSVSNAEQVPDEYAYRAIDEKKLADWVKLTEGKQAVPGCTIEQVNVLYAKEQS